VIFQRVGSLRSICTGAGHNEGVCNWGRSLLLSGDGIKARTIRILALWKDVDIPIEASQRNTPANTRDAIRASRELGSVVSVDVQIYEVPKLVAEAADKAPPTPATNSGIRVEAVASKGVCLGTRCPGLFLGSPQAPGFECLCCLPEPGVDPFSDALRNPDSAILTDSSLPIASEDNNAWLVVEQTPNGVRRDLPGLS